MQCALVIDKPAGITSHDVVARVRKIIGERRIGHTGTLDPFATGVLVLLIGPATRLGQFLSDAEKEYQAWVRLGYATDTGDATGARLNLPNEHLNYAQNSEIFTADQIISAMASLSGEIEQLPPMYSAKKVGGRRLYELARRGEAIERKHVRVNIIEFEPITYGDSLFVKNPDGTHDLLVRVVCSAGTYVRTLAEDFGKRLGVGAHLAELRRFGAGRFTIREAITLERLTELAESNSVADVLISPDDALSHLPSVEMSERDLSRTKHGIDLRVEENDGSNWPDGQPVRMRTAGNLIAVGKYSQAERIVHPSVVISGQ